MKGIFQDWDANKGNPKGRLVLVSFRIAHALRYGPRWLLPVTVLYGLLYRITVEWVLCIELPWKTRIGEGLRLDHGQALIVNDGTTIGKKCTLRNGTTIGVKFAEDGSKSQSPTLGNSVNVGANATILGPISIGDHAVIGAGAVVTKDVPSGAVVAGNPARIIRTRTFPA